MSVRPIQRAFCLAVPMPARCFRRAGTLLTVFRRTLRGYYSHQTVSNCLIVLEFSSGCNLSGLTSLRTTIPRPFPDARRAAGKDFQRQHSLPEGLSSLVSSLGARNGPTWGRTAEREN